MARIVECQQAQNPGRAEFFRTALTDDLKTWSGCTLIDESHLNDPLKWRKPSLIAAGFHGDIALLSTTELTRVLAVACSALRSGHRIMFLSKQPHLLVDGLRFAMNRIYGFHWRPPDGIMIGCSLMTQEDCDARLSSMRALSEAGWFTHVWREPQVERIEMRGWEFLKWQIVGGESGPKARPFDVQWVRDAIFWGKAHGIPTFVKQLGSMPVESAAMNRYDAPVGQIILRHPKGGDPDEWPADLRVRETPRGTL